LAFTNSIIADQRRKEVKLQEEIEALKSFSADSVNVPLMSAANREVKPRMYCDICETFDQHETEDCPNKKSKKRWSEQSQRNHHHHLESTAITVKCLAMTRLPVIRTTRRRKRITLFDFFLLIFRIRFCM
ncbi:hypothetical protein OSTOST_22842, partial [Ostertagia ostertagi]